LTRLLFDALDSGQDVFLAGSASGVSAASAQISPDRGLAGSSAASSTASASILRVRGVSGSASGVSASSGTIVRERRLFASSTALSTASGSLSRVRWLSGTTSGTSGATGALTLAGAVFLNGSASGTSYATGNLSGGSAGSSIFLGAYTATVVVSAPSVAGGASIYVVDAAGLTVGGALLIAGFKYFVSGVSGPVVSLTSNLMTNVYAGQAVFVQSLLPMDTSAYAVAHQTLLDLEAMAPHESVLVEMQNRSPIYIRSQPKERAISLSVFFLANSYQQRRLDYDDFTASLDSLSGVATLTWTGSDGRIREYLVTVISVSPDAWFNRATASLIAPNPYAIQVA
jgi:hypothetical protein